MYNLNHQSLNYFLKRGIILEYSIDQSQKIDKEKTRELVKLAINQGINYFDTAWGYHGGNSELVVGELLSAYPRDSYFLATKFPGYDASNIGKNGEIFEKQLEKLRTDYFDFYLVHCLSESNIEAYLDEKLGTIEYLIEQKKNGEEKVLTGNERFDNILYSGAFEDAAKKLRDSGLDKVIKKEKISLKDLFFTLSSIA